MARTNIDLNDNLVREAMRRTKCRTKKELVNLALQELVLHGRQKDILFLAGKIHWEGDLKAWRRDRT